MNTTRIKLPINVYFKCLRIKTGFTLNVEINFSEARKFFQLSLFRIFFVILQLGCCWKMIVMIYKIKLTYYLGVCCILADSFFQLIYLVHQIQQPIPKLRIRILTNLPIFPHVFGSYSILTSVHLKIAGNLPNT